ncbi:AAA family ATPase [Candidatus Halobeggiatoa sp. HSG11]|nr:AAA family ATPase [Candidatus Halobeggiatoa sp. HSG11]
MKILQLELIAFGLFTDKVLDFSTGDFHLLYGPNEAGKSSMHRALAHFFFGIPERTTDAYLHSNDKLRIGAKLLSNDDKELTCYRRKGRKNTLLDANNKPLDEDYLQTFLSKMNETQFTALSCFNHDRLRQGGEALLEGGGEVGESLFEAATGGLKIHDVLAELDKEKEELFKPRGTRPLLNKQIRIYKDSCKLIQDNSLIANKWTEQAEKLDNSKLQHTELTEQLQVLRAEQHRLERIQRTRPLLQRQQELKAKLTGFEQVILLPNDAATKHAEVKLILHTASAQEEQAIKDISILQQQIDAINISQTLLTHKTIIDNLLGRLGSHQKASRDLPGVRTEMRTVEADARNLLREIYPQLELEDLTKKLLVTSRQRDSIKKLAAQAPTLQEKQRNIEQRAEELEEQLQQHQITLNELPAIPDLTKLQVALNQADKHGDLEEVQRQDEQEIISLTKNINLGLQQIGWNNGVEALEQTALPKMERIDYFERHFNELDNDLLRIKEHLLEARKKNEDSTQKINELSWNGEIPTEEALIKSRKTRQKYWQKIKQANIKDDNMSLFSDSPPPYPFQDKIQAKPTVNVEVFKNFEESVFCADDISDRLRRDAKRVAEYGLQLTIQTNAKREQETLTKKWHTVEARIAQLQTEWEASWKETGIKPWNAGEMRSWLNDALDLRRQAAKLRERQQQLQERQQLIAKLCQDLTQNLTVLQPVEKNESLQYLIAKAENYISEITDLQRKQENLKLEIKNIIKDQKRSKITQQRADKGLQKWQIKWEKALKPLQLASDTTPETAQNALNDLSQVLNKLDKVRGLRRRVNLMQKDAELFVKEVQKIAQKIAPELANEPVEQIIPALSNSLQKTEKDLAIFEQLQQRLQAEQQRLTNTSQRVKVSEAHLQILLQQAHCENVEDLEIAEQQSELKKDLQQDLVEIEQQLLEQGEGVSTEELTVAAAMVDIDRLSGQLLNCKEQIQQLEQQRFDIDRTIGEAGSELKRMDGNDKAARAANESQLALAEINNLAERYIQVHLAGSILRKSMERYREQNQGPLLKRASELFQRLTLNSFCGLKTDYSGNTDQPVLVGVRRSDNSNILTTNMSDGTRDQLYLALRLASIERYIDKNAPIPLILDDILINFDDERSTATLKILGELCQKTQILFLTHSSRLVELAQATIPKKHLVKHRV